MPITPRIQTKQWLSRFVAILDGQRFVLSINPEEEETGIPSRSAAYNTLAGAYIEMWGAGIETYTISGSTGYSELHAGEGDGFAVYMKLLTMHRSYQNKCAVSDPASVKLLLIIPPYATEQNQLFVGGSAFTPGSAAQGAAPAPPAAVGGGNAVYRVNSENLQTFRNKSSPMLFRYRWQFTVLEDYLFPMTVPNARFQVNGPVAPSGNPQTLPGSSTTDLIPTLPSTPYTVPADGSIKNVNQIPGLNGPMTPTQITGTEQLNGLPDNGTLTPGQTIQIVPGFTLAPPR